MRDAKAALAATGRRLYGRGWCFGTSGNFSVVRSRNPLRLIISSSGLPKGDLVPAGFIEVDAKGAAIGRTRLRPSAETALHLVIAANRNAGAVLHTHSVASTVLSSRHLPDRGLAIEDLEMLKGLDGVATHEHREWIPIVPNSQDMQQLSADLSTALVAHPKAHAVLIAGHGMYAWGKTLADAERHVEILEFLLQLALNRAMLQ